MNSHPPEKAIELPPLSVIRRLPVITLIKFCRTAIIAAIQANCLEHVLTDLIEEMDMEDIMRIKPHLDRSEGILKRIIDRRIQWGDWPTGPVTEKDNSNGRRTEPTPEA